MKNLPKTLTLKLLKKLPLGHLELTLENNQTLHFGDESLPTEARVKIHNDEAFFKKCAYYGNIGMGEAYTDGHWDTDDIAATLSWFIKNMSHLQGSDTKSTSLPGVNLLKMVNWFRHLKRSNTVENSRRNIAEHYDLGNEFYALWLDPSMTYSCAKFEENDPDFARAQAKKYEALCQKLQLQKDDRVLEIGCGWGGFALHAVKNHGVKMTCLTISEAQAEYARKRVAEAKLTDQIEIRIQDYREVTGTFDKIASIEMLEAVGDNYHKSFFAKCAEVLTPSGLLAVQMITVPDCRYDSLTKGVDWIQRHVFPGSLLLSVGRVNQVLAKTGDLFMHGLEDLGSHYVKTLGHWHANFNNASKEKLTQLGFDEPFIRTWNYYLKYCQAGFATRNISVVQAVYTRPNNPLLAVQQY